MLEADIRLIPVINDYTALIAQQQLPIDHVAPMAVEWDVKDRRLSLTGTKSNAAGTIKLSPDGEWKLWSNASFSFVHESLKMEPFAFIKDLLERRIVQMRQRQLTQLSTVSCRSDEGVTQGLVDSIITLCRVLRHRDLSPAPVQEALKDLASDEDFAFLKGMLEEATGQGLPKSFY